MKKNILLALFACALLTPQVFAIGSTDITLQRQPAPLCNLIQVTVNLVNNDPEGATYDGPCSATITLPTNISFVRQVSITNGTITSSGQVITWTIPLNVRSQLRTPSTQTLVFLVSAEISGIYTVTGQAIDDQGITHILPTPEPVTANFPHLNNGSYAIAQNTTLIATLLPLLDTTSPATIANLITIQPNALHGTVTPTMTESPYIFTYIPEQDFVGYDLFNAQAQDACTCTDIASMFVAVGVEGNPATSYVTFLRELYNQTPSNKVPVAKNISLPNVNVNSSITPIDLRDYVDLTNGTAPFTYTLVAPSSIYGTPEISETILSYTANHAGDGEVTDTFAYKLTDSNGATSTGKITITINAT